MISRKTIERLIELCRQRAERLGREIDRLKAGPGFPERQQKIDDARELQKESLDIVDELRDSLSTGLFPDAFSGAGKGARRG